MRIHYLIMALVCLTLVTGVAAQGPGQAHQLWGDVQLNGNPAPDGLFVEAKIDGELIKATATLNGQYGIEPNTFVLSDNPSGSSYSGKTIILFVDGIQAGEIPFVNGARIELDLSITKNTGGGNNNGGGGGGGGGGGFVAPPKDPPKDNDTTESQPTICTPDWRCSDWFNCYQGEEERLCVDDNQCGTDDGKPSETQECTFVEIVDEIQEDGSASQGDFLTGFFIQNPQGTFGAVAAAIIILGVLIYWRASKSRKTRKKGKGK